MAKKKNSSAADDLIKSLLNEMNEDESASSESAAFSEFETAAPASATQFPLGLAPEEELKKNDRSEDESADNFENEVFKGRREEVDSANPYGKIPAKAPASAQMQVVQDDKTIPLKVSPLSYKVDPPQYFQNQVPSGSSVVSPMDASFLQAENLRIAQSRILQLEEEVDHLRREHEEVCSAADTVKNRSDEALIRIQELERERDDVRESSETEVMILKGQLDFKEKELIKALQQVEDLEVRLKNDFRKIRVRERELENRLELVRAEKSTLVRAKDDSILDLKRRVDQLQHEIENYRDKCLELNKTLESQKEQFKRTARALKMALTNLEVKDEDVIPLKKAE